MTIVTDIQDFTKECAEKGTAMAVLENKGTAKKSVTFCAVGREIFKGASPSGELNALNAFADAFRARYIATSKQALSEYLQYIVKGYNAEAINSVTPAKRKLVHCYSTKQNAPAVFTFEAKPAKPAKQKTASGKSDAPSASPIDRDTATTEQKVSLIADLPNPYTEQALIRALFDGSLSMATLKRAVGRYEMDKASKIITKSANRAQSAIDKELQDLMATC